MSPNENEQTHVYGALHCVFPTSDEMFTFAERVVKQGGHVVAAYTAGNAFALDYVWRPEKPEVSE